MLPGLGPGSIPTIGTVADLLCDIPYLVWWGAPLPSRAQLNSLLRTGYYDAGMSGGAEWPPFELTEDEYAEVVQALASDGRLVARPISSVEGVAEPRQRPAIRRSSAPVSDPAEGTTTAVSERHSAWFYARLNPQFKAPHQTIHAVVTHWEGKSGAHDRTYLPVADVLVLEGDEH
jgi:hypothetical protein